MVKRPINKMISTIRKITTGDLVQRVAVTSQDELGELASAFNQMTEDLNKNRSKLEEYSTHLESMVQERTSELEKKILELEESRKAILNILEDATEAKNIAEESEKKYRTLFEESKDVIFISTPAGEILDINPAGVKLFGYSSKEELQKVNVADNLYMNYHDRERYHREMVEQGFVKDFELALKKKNGEKLTVLETATAVYNEKGEIAAYRGIMRDVTREKQLELQLFQSQKMEAIGILAGGIAHDFNNLLTTIIGNTQLGLMQIKPDNPIYQRFKEIEKTAHRAAALTKQILAFSRRQMLEIQALDINNLIKEFSKMIQRLIGEHIELKIITTEKPCPVSADPNALEQVLMNLAVNARDAMPEGGILEIQTERLIIEEDTPEQYPDCAPGEYVFLTISDTGVGIPPEIRDRVFEPFFSTKEPGKGTGLGLSVVHGIIKQHEGFIELESEQEKGTKFKMYIPVSSTAQKIQPDKTYQEIPEGSETILIAEDEEQLRNLAHEILDSLGYSVMLAKNGQEALEIFKGNKDEIDLVVLDMVMPKMGGQEAYKKMREIRPELPILFITGYSSGIEKIKEFLHYKELNLLQKPFTVESLANKVREVLNQLGK
jgi:PAS domain S-box-containing protein